MLTAAVATASGNCMYTIPVPLRNDYVTHHTVCCSMVILVGMLVGVYEQ